MSIIHLYFKENRWQAFGLSADLLITYMPELSLYDSPDSKQKAVSPRIEDIVTRFSSGRILVSDDYIDIYIKDKGERN